MDKLSEAAYPQIRTRWHYMEDGERRWVTRKTAEEWVGERSTDVTDFQHSIEYRLV